MKNLFIDFETLSECDIKKSGADAYARHPSTAIICMAYSIDGGRPSIYVPPEELKRSLLDPSDFPYHIVTALPYVAIKHVQTGGTVTAHNVTFDYNIWNRCAPKDWPRLHPEQVDCTMAKACAMALPASLGMLGEALNVPLKKNPSGSRLIKKMCTPPFESSPDLMAEMLEYCARDVETMSQINKRLKPLSDDEQTVWLTNFKANQRGLRLDQELICEAIRLAGEADVELGQQAESVAGLSLGALRSPKQVLEWLETQGVDLPALDKATMATFETDNTLVQQVLELREEVCKSSIKKFLTMEGNTCPDGRARGNHVYHKATTGRFAGSGIQIQNLPRPALDDPDSAADHLATHGTLPDGLGVSTKTALSSLLRSCIIPAEGKEFFCADFSSIESRVLFWLAGDKKGLDVYKQGGDLYCVTASGIFGYPVNKKEHPRERSIGKVAVLSLGYGGGVKAFQGMCEQMGVDLEGVNPQRVVDGYRDTYQKTRQFWWDCESAAMNAMENPNTAYKAGKYIRFKYRAKDQDLRALLPSGRVIHWPFPELKEELTPWGAMKNQISFGSMGLNHKWTRKRTYAGDLAQSCTQATARDLLTSAMVRIDSAGFPVVLHVHDEVMSEVSPSADFDTFIKLMETAPSWAKGLPVRAEGWRGHRYAK